MNILIVDDEQVIRQGIQRTLSSRFPGYRLYLAANPEEAVLQLRQQRMDVVLTDVLMPGMTGLELMQLTKSLYSQTKWVVISAYSEFKYAQEAVKLGAKDYLLKPIGKETLVEMIEKLTIEIEGEQAKVEEVDLLRANRKFLREAVFRRWSLGLDIGRIDMEPFMESYPSFYLVMVKMETDKDVHLEHFIIENVLTELIEKYGRGFITIYDSESLLGLVAPQERTSLLELVNELRKHLIRYIKVPFQVIHTDLIKDSAGIPTEVQRMRQASTTQVYEHYAKSGEQMVEVALQYIRAHYQSELSLEKVAAVVYLNPVYFSQLFKQKSGLGFKEYIIQLRLERAKQLLLNSKLKLADIAERIGYQDIRHFAQLFRKKYGETPSEYRNRQPQASDNPAALD